MDVAFRRVIEAKAEIRKTPRDTHVESLVQLLFGNDNAKVTDAAKRLENVHWLSIFNSAKPDPYDVIIYCSTDRIIDVFNEAGVRTGYRDTDRKANVTGYAIMDSCRNVNHIVDASTRAITINAGPKDKDGKDTKETLPDTIQLCPWYLRQLAGPPPKYDTPDELVKKTGDVKAKSLVGKLSAKLAGGEIATPVDALVDFAQVLLHEMTHSAVAGYSDDTPKNKCYGWRNSVKCKESKNADSLAYFALAVELVLHRGYTVNKDGTLQKLM